VRGGFEGYEWDQEKSDLCAQERGFDFVYAAHIWAGGPVLETAARKVEGEGRALSVGMVGDLTIAVIWTARGQNRCIISARPASRKERHAYRAHLEKAAYEDPWTDKPGEN
jgi:uncharacterized protein